MTRSTRTPSPASSLGPAQPSPGPVGLVLAALIALVLAAVAIGALLLVDDPTPYGSTDSADSSDTNARPRLPIPTTPNIPPPVD